MYGYEVNYPVFIDGDGGRIMKPDGADAILDRNGLGGCIKSQEFSGVDSMGYGINRTLTSTENCFNSTWHTSTRPLIFLQTLMTSLTASNCAAGDLTHAATWSMAFTAAGGRGLISIVLGFWGFERGSGRVR